MLEKTLLKSGSALVILSIIAAIFSFLKEMVFASCFGVSGIADAYAVAIQIPEALFFIVWQVLNTIVIPIYADKLYNANINASSIFISNFITIMGLGGIVLICMAEIFAGAFIYAFSPGLTMETHALATSLVRWVFPVFLFDMLIRVNGCILNVHKKFALPKALNIIRNIGMLIFLLLFLNRFGVHAAVYGLLAGVIVECVLFIAFTYKYQKYHFILDFHNADIIKAGRLAIPTLIGAGAAEINQIADKIISSFLITGSIASLNYAAKINNIVYVIFINNIIVLCYPVMAEYAAKSQKKELAAFFIKSIKYTIIICVPIIVGGIALRDELVSLAFARGAFDVSAIHSIGNLFMCYLVSSLFTVICLIASKIFIVCGDTKTVMVNSIIGVFINVSLNIVFSRMWGAFGLAFATMISMAFICIRIMTLVTSKLMTVSYKSTVILLSKSLVSSLAMYSLIIMTKEICGDLLESVFQIQMLVFVAGAVIAGLVIYTLFLLLLRVDELKVFKNLLNARKY